MKKLGDAIGQMDMAGHMGRDENSEAAEGSSPCTLSSKDMELINLKSRGRGEGGTCTPPIVPPTTPKKSATPESQNPAAPVSLDVALRASLPLGIPDWFIAYWYEKQNAFDWVTTHGKKLTAYTWKSNLLSWWNHKTPLEKASIESEYKDAIKSAAEEADDPEPKIEITAHPEELEEARWRNDANEPTEEECAAVRAWLAWVSRAKARGKARKEAGMKS